jgi:hypothetical protein
LDKSKNVFEKFLRFHRLVKTPICIQIVANGPAGLPIWCLSLIQIPYWCTTFWASHHQIPF